MDSVLRVTRPQSRSSSQMPFNDYVTIPPSTPFSRDYFRSLSFLDLDRVQLPSIAKRSSVVHWFHVPEAPQGPDALRILDGEVIPHIEDLLDMLSSMEGEFLSGSRGVFICLRVDGQDVNFTASYAKVCSGRSLASRTLLMMYT